MPLEQPIPTPIYRLMHVENLGACLERGQMFAPNHTPAGGPPYRTIHREDIHAARSVRDVPKGPRGTIHDYVSFYFGPRSVMLYQLHTGWVPTYTEGQEPLIHLVSTCQAVSAEGLGFVFSDATGWHGLQPGTTISGISPRSTGTLPTRPYGRTHPKRLTDSGGSRPSFSSTGPALGVF